jgi:hypothetical protein
MEGFPINWIATMSGRLVYLSVTFPLSQCRLKATNPVSQDLTSLSHAFQTGYALKPVRETRLQILVSVGRKQKGSGRIYTEQPPRMTNAPSIQEELRTQETLFNCHGSVCSPVVAHLPVMAAILRQIDEGFNGPALGSTHLPAPAMP